MGASPYRSWEHHPIAHGPLMVASPYRQQDSTQKKRIFSHFISKTDKKRGVFHSFFSPEYIKTLHESCSVCCVGNATYTTQASENGRYRTI
jgi:hypothetical protein